MTRKYSSQGLSAKQVQDLVESPEWSVDTDMTARIPENIFIEAIYSHSNGQVLAVLKDGAGWLYESRKDWLSRLADLEQLQAQEPVHFLAERLPQGQRFANVAPELIGQLARELNIPVEELDRSRSSLERVDQAIQQKGQDECLKAKIFSPLVAYIGEVIKSNTNAEWEMRSAMDGKTWEPWIVASGRSFPISSMLYDELYEEQNGSVFAIVDVCI